MLCGVNNMADIEEKIREDLDIERIDDKDDVYSDEAVEELVENGEMSNEEAAFMKGYNEADEDDSIESSEEEDEIERI